MPTSRGTSSFHIAWPDSAALARYRDSTGEPHIWLDVAVISQAGDRCLSRIETALAPPIPRLALWHTPLHHRDHPQPLATWPRPREPRIPADIGPASQYPLFAPGDTVALFLESWAEITPVPPMISAMDLARGTGVPLSRMSANQMQGPWGVREWRLPVTQPSVYRIDASLGDATTSTVIHVAPQSDLRSALWDKGKGVQVLGSQYPFHDPEQFAHENHCGRADSGLAWGPFARSRPGQPWCDFIPNSFCYLPNGIHYRTWIREGIREHARNIWTGETLTVSASLVDGFNGVPWPDACLHPQHLAMFGPWLRDRYGEDLTNVSLDSVATRALADLNGQWRVFVATQLALPAHHIVQDEIRGISPASQLTDQFDLPLLPTLLRIPDAQHFAEEWQTIFSISSSDAWNIRAGRDYHAATYLVCAGKALAPRARVGHYHMEMLGGLGPERIAKTELIRRQNADLFWMMAAAEEGWVPVETYVDGGGVSWLGGWQTWLDLSSRSLRGGHIAFPEDWHALEYLYALDEAIRPQQPRGFAMAAVGPRIEQHGDQTVIVGDLARLFGMLRGAGLPISAMIRLDLISPATMPDGLIIPVPGKLSTQEIEGIRLCLSRRIPMGIIAMGLDDAGIASCLGIDQSLITSSQVVILRQGNVRGPFWPDGTPEDYAGVATFVEALNEYTPGGVSVSPGVSWYSFETTRGLAVVLLEERGEPRIASIHVSEARGVKRAIELMAGRELMVDPAENGVVVDVPLSACGAALVEVIHD